VPEEIKGGYVLFPFLPGKQYLVKKIDMLIDIARLLDLRMKRLLFPKGKGRVLYLGDVQLKINELDEGGKQYNSRKSYEEIFNPLYRLIANDIQPDFFLDIGANYGFISIVASRYFPTAKLIMVEPGKRLDAYILDNMKLNSISNFELVNAICGEEERKEVSFAMNPFSSQDNRVIAPKKNWKTEVKKMVSIDGLLANIESNTPIFIKIDVQGFEEMVFKGGAKFLASHRNWITKTEFAPKWLSSQGTNPLNFLTGLVEEYEVVELTGRTSYQSKSLNELFVHPIQTSEVQEFLDYIISLDKDGRGWCDLLIRPKK
jgi:FkbM family methyltransferase